MDFERLKELSEQCGFTHIGKLKVSTIRLLPEVREMCEVNTCGRYGKNWRCPPGSGTLEECGERIRKFKEGVLVQTVGELEDALDGEAMMETEAEHKKHFYAMQEILEKEYPGMLALGSGTCTKCKECTYPDAPCRFPDNSFASMESYGMLVTDVCKANDMPYYYGSCTIAYTSCFLLE